MGGLPRVLEELSEEQLLDIDRTSPLPNASLTVYDRVDDGFVLRQFGDASAIETLAAPVTHERDARQRAGETTS